MTTMTRNATTIPSPRPDVPASGAATDSGADARAREGLQSGQRSRRRLGLILGVTLFFVAACLRIGLVPRTGLWADELFSLAMATGHSLEHKADIADATKGDYVESHDAVAPDVYRQYLRHDSPPA